MIIGICGRQGSGKDTVADMINKLTNHKYQRRRFASKLKECAGILLGVPASLFEDRDYKDSYIESYGMTVREFLQRLGTDAVRNNVHPNTWVTSLLMDYSDGDDWIISDVRFINEADYIKFHGGTIIKVNRITKHDLHPSENELDFIIPDYEISNSGSFFDLEYSVKKILNNL